MIYKPNNFINQIIERPILVKLRVARARACSRTLSPAREEVRRRFRVYLSVCSKDRWPDRQSEPRQSRREEFNHTPQSPSPPSSLPPSIPPPHFPICSTPPLLSSPTPFITSFILCLHLSESLHFRCIHTFSISLCMSFPPSLSPRSSLHTSLCSSIPPFFCVLPSSSHPGLFLYFLPSTSFLLYSLHPITVIHHSSISHHANRPPGYHSNHLRPGSVQPPL